MVLFYTIRANGADIVVADTFADGLRGGREVCYPCFRWRARVLGWRWVVVGVVVFWTR
jgi:hypothetical protein